MDAEARTNIGIATSVVGSAPIKTLVEKVMAKQFCGKVATGISSMAVSRATGSVVGGTLGTIDGLLGTMTGVDVGTAPNVGENYVLPNIDEMQNQETHKQEVIVTIREERAEKLALARRETIEGSHAPADILNGRMSETTAQRRVLKTLYFIIDLSNRPVGSPNCL